MDKYAGRTIHFSNFKQSLLSFLDNGTHYLIGFIPTIISKLENLICIVKELPNFRFYASSLLILYDGNNLLDLNSIDIRMIDFANCVTNAHLLYDSRSPRDPLELTQNHQKVNFAPTTNGPDQGYLLGLETLCKSFSELYKELGNGQGHILKENLLKSLRVTAEVGLVDSLSSSSAKESFHSTSPLMMKKTSSSAATGSSTEKVVLDLDSLCIWFFYFYFCVFLYKLYFFLLYVILSWFIML